jgi:predicted transcriptional regulator
VRMKCEKAVNDIFPVARSMIAKKLVEVYGLSQTAAAKKMGISQPAVSQYRKDIRGTKAKELVASPGFEALANEVAKGLAEGSVSEQGLGGELCRFCMLVEGESKHN